METRSLWNQFTTQPNFPSLRGDEAADVVVVGGGITGITLAVLLAEEGIDVTVLEAGKVGRGTTSHSTGNLYCTTDQNLAALKSAYSLETVKKLIDARRAALEFIAGNVRHYKIDCDFSRRTWYLYSEDRAQDETIARELRVAIEAGLRAELAGPDEFPYPISSGMKVADQAQFNPLLYVEGLAKAAAKENLRIYEDTRAESIREKDGRVSVSTTGGKITARYGVHATHTPKGKMVRFQTLLGPYREYGVAATLRNGGYPEGIFWGRYDNSETISVRSYQRGDTQVVMAIGKPHKVGQKPDNDRNIQALEQFLKERFDLGQVLYRWGGQHYRPADQLPYIGRKKEGSSVFVATGFSTDGLVYGSLSGMIIRDLITGKQNPHAELFNATRNQPVKAAKKFVKENVDVGVQYLRNLPSLGEEPEFEQIPNGAGRIVDVGGKKIAAYRKPDGTFELLSAVCTHMACIVEWNKAEKSWDCPCHATRFDTRGEVIEGPAFHPLRKIER